MFEFFLRICFVFEFLKRDVIGVTFCTASCILILMCVCLCCLELLNTTCFTIIRLEVAFLLAYIKFAFVFPLLS